MKIPVLTSKHISLAKLVAGTLAMGTLVIILSESRSAGQGGGTPVPLPCWVEYDDCTVCWQAGARILCGSGWILCPDQVIGTDPPFRSVREAGPNEPDERKKRSENYGSCTWQPRQWSEAEQECVDNGPQMQVENVMGEETHGNECTGEVVEE